MRTNGYTCIECLAAGLILGLIVAAVAKHIEQDQSWQKSGELASRALAQEKLHHQKELK